MARAVAPEPERGPLPTRASARKEPRSENMCLTTRPKRGALPLARTWTDVLTPSEAESLLIRPVPLGTTQASITDLLADPLRRPVADAVERGKGRLDITLGLDWTESAERHLPGFRKVVALIDAFRREHESRCRGAKLRWHAMRVQPRASAQGWHMDSGGHRGAYFTFLVPLTRDPDGSGTEFPVCDGAVMTGTRVANTLGDVHGFSGDQWHRGTSHRGPTARVFLYAALYRGRDPNDAV